VAYVDQCDVETTTDAVSGGHSDQLDGVDMGLKSFEIVEGFFDEIIVGWSAILSVLIINSLGAQAVLDIAKFA
jgi:hypothetical protein